MFKRKHLALIGSWFEILSLPFKFFASELFIWNMNQLQLLAKLHRAMMITVIFFSLGLIGTGLLAVQSERIEQIEKRIENRIEEVKKAMDKGDLRIDLVQQQVNDINIQVTKIVSSVDSLTTNLVWGLRILGGMALVLLGQFATYVFGVKMQREISRVADKPRK